MERKEFRTRVLQGFLRAGRQLGYRPVDPSDPDQVGKCAGDGDALRLKIKAENK